MRDLTINSDQPDDPDRGLMDIRSTNCIQDGNKVHIEDITSSQIQIIDTQDKVLKVVEAMEAANLNPLFRAGDDNIYSRMVSEVMIKWVEMDQKEKISKYSKYVCHELNFFIFKKDRLFFDTVAKFYVQNKMEKTFIDWYLLAHSSDNEKFTKKLLCYLDSLAAITSELNTFEVCLLIETALKFGDEHQKGRACVLAKNLID